MSLLFLLVPGYFLLQVGLPIWLSGRDRTRSLYPLVVSIPLLGFVLFATLVKHSNLAPIWLVFAAPFGCLYLIVIWLMSRKK